MNQFSQDVLTYYDKHKRDLPWREVNNPYYTWLSEIMLQQTRVEAVKEYFARFTRELPTIEDLANADEELLLKLWEGLGYYSRVRNLQKAARQIMENYEGKLPEEKAELLSLAGIGDYTAAAIASICYGKKEVALDGNLIRVFSRLFAQAEDFSKQVAKRELIRKIEELMPEDRAGDFNQAMMDIGAMICIPNGRPLCESCPVRTHCKAFEDGNMLSYPLKKEKKARKIEQKTLFLLHRDGNGKSETLLRKRKGKGVLMGLWEFPSADGHLNMREVREAVENEILEMEYQIIDIKELPPARHIFSHLEWDMKAYYIVLKLREEIMAGKIVEERALVRERINNTDTSKEIGVSEEKSLYNPEEIVDNEITEIGIWASKKQIAEELSLPSAFKSYQTILFQSL